jgi:hypothetical protein
LQTSRSARPDTPAAWNTSRAGTVADVRASRDIVVPLAALLVVAALVRVVAWSRTAVLFNDGPVFLAIAEAIGEGRWTEVLAHPYHPLYPASIHVLSKLGLTPENAAVGVSILGALMGIVALHALLRRAFGIEVAWLGAWVLALHPWAIDFSADVMSDGLYLGLYLASFTALARLVERPTVTAAAAFGAFTVLAFLVRPEALGLLFLGGLLLGIRVVRDAEFREAALRPIVGLIVVAGLGLAPYVGLVSVESGELTLTQKKSVAALIRGEAQPTRVGSEPIRPDIVKAAIWLPQSAAVPGSGQPPRNLEGAVEAMIRVLRTSAAALRYEVLLFVVIGIAMLRRERGPPWRAATFALPVVLYSALLVLLVWGAGYVSRRHALPALMPLLGFAAVAWQRLGQAVISRWARWAAASGTRPESGSLRGPFSDTASARIATGALIIVLALAWGPRDLRERRSDRIALREAAEWIGARFANPGPLAAEKLRMAYYADAAYVPLRAGAGESLETTLLRGGADLLLVDGDRLDRYPGLVDGMGSWLREIHSVEHDDRRALVFEIARTPAR